MRLCDVISFGRPPTRPSRLALARPASVRFPLLILAHDATGGCSRTVRCCRLPQPERSFLMLMPIVSQATRVHVDTHRQQLCCLIVGVPQEGCIRLQSPHNHQFAINTFDGRMYGRFAISAKIVKSHQTPEAGSSGLCVTRVPESVGLASLEAVATRPTNLRVSALNLLRSWHSQFTHERQRFTRGRLSEIAHTRERDTRLLMNALTTACAISFTDATAIQPVHT